MGIEVTEGDLLAADVDALVNPVNCVGVMGKGLALQFKRAFPHAFQEYAKACKAGEVVPGKVHVVRRSTSPETIFHFPTKKHWRHPSRLEWVVDGLADLKKQVRELEIASIAIPALGCGLGGLQWGAVRPAIEAAFAELPEVTVWLYGPGGASRRP